MNLHIIFYAPVSGKEVKKILARKVELDKKKTKKNGKKKKL